MLKNPEENPIRPTTIFKTKQPIKRLKLFDNMLVSSSADSKLRVWTINDRTGVLAPTATLKGHTGPVTKIKLHDGLLYTLSTRDEVLRSWDLKTNTQVKAYKGHSKYLTSFVIDNKENTIFTSSFDHLIIAWDMKTGEAKGAFKGHEDGVTSIKLADDFLISCSADKTIRIWTKKTGQCTKILHGHSSFIFGMHVDGSKIYSHSQDGTVRIWNIKTGEPIQTIEVGYPVINMKVSKKTLFTQGAKQVNSFSLKGKESDVYEGHSAPILCSVFYKNYFFTGAADATIRGWSWKRGKQAHLHRGHEAAVNSVVVKDNWLYSGGQDGSIIQWKNEVYLKEEHGGWV
jgi:WD40 repeat protein